DRRKAVNGSKILVVGVAYKPGIDDMRESPALDIIELLADGGAEMTWYDPHVPSLPAAYSGDKLEKMTKESVGQYDAVVIVTPHKDVDHLMLLNAGPVVIDTRNALKGHVSDDLVKL
ncbi:MAG: UDP-N-acetyl-D-glucosamine dehydrogenase, partial [Candidatus Krumholzibacteriia bacterium]